MRSWTIAFLLGIVCLNTLSIPTLPTPFKLVILLSLLIYPWYFYHKKYPLISQISLAFFLGFLWANLFAYHLLSHKLVNEFEYKPITVIGTVASIPENTPHGIKFTFIIRQIISQQEIIKQYLPVSLTWINQHTELTVGESWQLTIKLKRLHSFANPGGFDFAALALEKGIRATGYVIPNNQTHKNLPAAATLRRSGGGFMLTRIRQHIDKIISRILGNNPYVGIIKALTIGERSEISQQQWQTLSATGTNHLVVIAGLHIGIWAGFFYKLTSFLWRYNGRLLLVIPAPIASRIGAIVAAFFYSAMAGFSIPTQRAFIMLLVLLFATTLKRQIPTGHAICLALIMTLVIDPLAVTGSSFWLSFGSVSIIAYGMNGRINVKSWWWHWGRIQWVVSLGLLPLTLLFFQRASLMGFLANAISIPYIGFLVEPLCLLGTLIAILNQRIGQVLLHCATNLIAYLWPILQWFAHLHTVILQTAIVNISILLCAIIGILLWLAPKGIPGRWLAGIWLSPIFFYHLPGPQLGGVTLTVLDVGQGLATVVRTAHHTLIFDAGPKFSPDFDAGNAIVLPYLRSQGINHINKMVISHPDSDHIGGAFSLLQQISINTVDTSKPSRFAAGRARDCIENTEWQWDDVKFKYLYPPKNHEDLDNNSSCVLLITAGKRRILLPGDIEKSAEAYLVAQQQLLATDILIAPHHGSATSSTDAFISVIKPKLVIFSFGYLNKYHFPNLKVIARYHAIDAKLFNTVASGAITVFISPASRELTITEYRKTKPHYWD